MAMLKPNRLARMAPSPLNASSTPSDKRSRYLSEALLAIHPPEITETMNTGKVINFTQEYVSVWFTN